MKRFLLFAMYGYYPDGGWGDFVDSYDTLEEAVACGDGLVSTAGRKDWYHVVDTEIGSEVAYGSRECQNDI